MGACFSVKKKANTSTSTSNDTPSNQTPIKNSTGTSDLAPVVPQVTAKQRVNYDSITTLELNALSFLDSRQSCIDYIVLDTLNSLCTMQACTGKESIEDLLNFFQAEGRQYGRDTYEEELGRLKDDIQSQKISTNVMYYYTKESCIYHLINDIFSGSDYKKLFKIRYIIHLLNKQLSQIQQGQVTQVFSGGAISKDDIPKLQANLHRPILLKGFVSASTKSSIAEDRAIKKQTDERMYKILLKINVDEMHQQMLHSIKSYSQFPDEEEYLLNCCSILTVDKITMNNDRLDISCTFSDFDACKQFFSPMILEYKHKFREVLDNPHPNDKFILYDIYNQLGRHDDCQAILNEINEKRDDIDSLKLQTLASVSFNKNDYEGALKLYEESLAVASINQSSTAGIYNNMGVIYYNKGDFANSLKCYQKSLEIRLSHFGESHYLTAESYRNIGLVHCHQKDFDSALDFSQKALRILMGKFGEKNAETAACYNNLGLIYFNKKEYDKALENYNKFTEIQSEILGANHPSLMDAYNFIGMIYSNRNDVDNTLNCYEKLLCVQRANFGENHPSTAASYIYLGRLYYIQKDDNNTVRCLEKYTAIQSSSLEADLPSLASAYTMLGDCYANKKEYDKALTVHEKSLKIQICTLGEKHPNVVPLYTIIGYLSVNKGDPEKALKYAEKSLEIQLEILGERHPSIACLYNIMASAYILKGEIEVAYQYSEKALQIQLVSLGEMHPETALSFYNHGLIYKKRGDKENSVKFFQRALEIQVNTIGKDHSDTLKTEAELNNK